MIVERQQHALVHLGAGELLVGDEGVDRADHLELLRAARLAIAVDVAAGVQVDLAPDADGIERHLDLVQPLGGAALAPELVVGRMLLDHQIEVVLLLARMLAVGGVPVDDAVLVPPVGAEEIAEHAALVDRGAVEVVHAVERRDAFQRRRLLDRHPPLRHAEVGLADAADLAARPRLVAEPFDHVVQVLLLGAVEQAEFAARLAAAAHVHVGVDVAVRQIELDRAGLAPQELRTRRQRVVVIAIGRRRKQHRKRPVALRHVERDGDFDAVVDADFHFTGLKLRGHRCPRLSLCVTDSIGLATAATQFGRSLRIHTYTRSLATVLTAIFRRSRRWPIQSSSLPFLRHLVLGASPNLSVLRNRDPIRSIWQQRPGSLSLQSMRLRSPKA